MEPREFLFENARIVLADKLIEGWLAVTDGRIVEIGAGRAPGRGIDCREDFLLPGLVELHTDHLEAHVTPRPNVRWNPVAAVVAYDAQIAAAGITTVFDSLRVGQVSPSDTLSSEHASLAAAIRSVREVDMLRADHRTHLRCEIAAPDVVAMTRSFAEHSPIDLLSLMDHTPGQRQFRDLAKMRAYYTKHGYVTERDFERFVAERLQMHEAHAVANRRDLVKLARASGAAIASHDDATTEHVEEAIADAVSIAEFPTTSEAANASHTAGLSVLMGAPNLVRGGSHSGNVAAAELARDGILDMLSSDYVPASLLLAAFELPHLVPGFDLAAAVRLISKNPAEATGLGDRGELALGKRADLVRVNKGGSVPIVRAVWREGRRVV
jgi:alpha-D-ribose 1-methylphosphonate 5-triphosphate diphosphatase